VWLWLYGPVIKTNRKEAVSVARKRMYDNGVTSSDDFISMPSSAQALYFHLNQMADDDGFNNQIQMAMMMAHASTDDLRVLMAKHFIIRFECGVIVIKHWRLHNTLRKDRYTPTNYQEEFRLLGIKENGAYTLGCQVVANVLPDGCHSIDKNSKDKDSLAEDSIEEAAPPKSPRHKYGMYENVLFTDEEYQKLKEEFPHDHTDRIERLSEYIASTGKKYKSHLATIRSWARKDMETKPNDKPKGGSSFLDLVESEYD
jgi:hypothetical protein